MVFFPAAPTKLPMTAMSGLKILDRAEVLPYTGRAPAGPPAPAAPFSGGRTAGALLKHGATFERNRATERVIVYYKGQRMGEARPLDPIANDRKPSLTDEAAG